MVLTGIALAFLSGAIRQGDWFALKLASILAGTILGLVAFRRNHRGLALASVLVFGYSYAVSYAKHPLLIQPQRAEIISTPSATPEARFAAGQKVYVQQCQHCHGENGALNLGGAKNLAGTPLDAAGIKNLVLNGKGNMAAYKNVLTPAEMDAVTAYVLAFRSK